MEELLGLLCILLVAVPLLAAVGHLLWLLFAALGRLIFGSPAAPEPSRRLPADERPMPCVRCNQLLEAHQRRCPKCKLHRDSPAASELRDLQATARQLQRLLDGGDLDRATGDQLYASIEARQRRLMEGEPAAPLPVPLVEPDSPRRVRTLAQELEALLGSCEDVRNLSLGDRQRAVACSRRASAQQLAYLSASAQLALARLLRLAGLLRRSLEAYRRLLEQYPAEANFVEAALEAARCALRLKDRTQAEWFLERALTMPLTEKQRHEAEGLRAKCRQALAAVTAVEEDIPEVLLVAPVLPAPRVKPLAPVEVVPPEPPAAPPPPRRPLGQMLAAFMEDRNILWGELVGGLLIVGCSIALVISLWQTLERIPYFPFLILAGTTAALFGAGLYTLHHWKLQSTSQGLLVIATLLVPLNFLVLAGLSKGQSGGGLEIAIEVVALAAFGWLVSRAAQVVAAPELLPGVRGGRWLLTLAVVGASAAQLLVPRLVALQQPALWLFYLAGLLPVACHGAATGLVLRGSTQTKPLQDWQANALFAFLGLATFALGVTLGFLLYRSIDAGLTLQRLSLLIALAGVPVLATGLVIFRGLDVSGLVRTAGTAVALGGAIAVLVALGLAWPQPVALVLVCALNFAVLATAALRGRLPLLHAVALPCLGLGYLTGLLLLAGRLPPDVERPGQYLLGQLLSSSSGVALTGLVLVLAVASELLKRRERTADGTLFVVASTLAASLSLVLVSLHATAAPLRAALVYGLYGAGCLAINVRGQWPRLTYLGTTLVLGCLLFLMVDVQADTLTLEWRGLIALLGHALLFVVASVALGRRLFEPPLNSKETFVVPFRRAALASTLIALPLLPFAAGRPELAWLAGCVSLISLVWLVVAWTERWPVLFSAFQVALTAAVLVAVSAWLQRQAGWLVTFPAGLLQPWALQTYGLALAGLSMMWVAARLVLLSNKRARKLLEPGWPAVDRVVLATAVVGQLVLVIAGVAPGVIGEVTPLYLGETAHRLWAQCYGPEAWMLAGALMLVLVIALVGRRRTDAVLGLTLLGLTVPLLVAGPFAADLATATALRWTLAIAFLIGSVLLWLRGSVFRFEAEEDPTPAVRRLLVAGCVVPVLVLTVVLISLRFVGQRPAGPLAGTFFREIGSLPRHLVPVGLVGVALVGHALRERSAGYAFAAGLIATAALTGGYALSVVLGGGQFGGAEWVRILQLGASGAAAWAIGWTLLRRWAIARGLHAEGGFGGLRQVQVWLGGLLLGALLISAVYLLTALVPLLEADVTTAVYLAAPEWTRETGSLLGWLALGIVAAAGALHGRKHKQSAGSRQWLGVASLAVIALLACTVERLAPTHGYRTLMIGLAGLALIHALLAASEVGLIGLTGTLALVLAGKAALVHQDPLGAAVAVALVSGAAAVLACRRRQEAWAFAVGLGVPLTTALVVWYVHWSVPFVGWWLYLVQACVVSVAAVALIWLAARRWVYEGQPLPALRASEGQGVPRWRFGLAESPLLAVQVLLGLLGNGLLLAPALAELLARPAGPMSLDLLRTGQWSGWLALLPAVAAALWYVRLIAPARVIHAAGVGGWLLGILAACLAARWDRGGWLAHHVLTVAWSLLGLALLTAGWVGASLPLLGPAFWPRERRAYCAERLAEFFPARSVRRWVVVLGLLVVGLALRGAWGDPARPYWSSAATLGVSAMAAALAIWSRRPFYVYASGLLVNVVGLLAWQAWLVDEIGFVGWWAWGPGILNSFVYTNALCLALASAFWSLIGFALRRRRVDLYGSWPAFPPLASLAALQLLAVLILGGLASDLTGIEMHATGPLAGPALGAAILAAALGFLNDSSGRSHPSLQLYVAGLLMVGLTLHGARLSPLTLGWWSALALAGYILLARVLVGVVSRVADGRWGREAGAWLSPAQLLVGALVLALSVWMSLAFGLLGERLAGPLAVALLLAAAILAAQERSPTGTLHLVSSITTYLRPVALLLGAVLVTEIGWALLPPELPASWLHRNVVLMAALAGLAVVYGLGLVRLLPHDGEWARAARQTVPLLGGLALALLAVVLVQELFLYNPDPEVRRTPMVLPAVLVVAVTLLLLIVAALVCAVSARRDPFGLSERGRTLYVYAAEVLLVLLLVHLRLNVPDLLPTFIGQRWPVVLLMIAFLGVGLAEWFERRGLHVLAGPLRRTGIFLPLLPVAVYLLRPVTAELREALGQAVTGLQPLLNYLNKMPGGYEMHALVWFLLGGLYVLLAVTRRSSVYGLLAALAANFGLWVVLANQMGTGFLAHPQFWLVPLALILLAAGHVNRERLTLAQAGAVRYGALLLLYLSSTADMFIAGLGGSVVWPLVLALLAIAGVLSGIVLRVRAFLYLGVSFLFLVVFAQIWHAAVDRAQTWVWWVSGIVLGVAILALFAVFEKRRNDVLRLVEEIKKWE